MLMSLEIPEPFLDDLDPLVDFHFAISTELVKNEAYFAWYKNYLQKPLGERKFVMLDNGVYEEGEPMKGSTLIDISFELKPDLVFAPDYLHSASYTMTATTQFLIECEERGYKGNIGIIPQGKNLRDLLFCHDYLTVHSQKCYNVTTVGLSFGLDREALVSTLVERKGCQPPRNPNLRYHMLGLKSLDEISTWPDWVTSFDTVKPIKAAFFGYPIEAFPRGKGKWSSDMDMPKWKRSLMYRNIAKLREACTKKQLKEVYGGL